ncbi:hypothetical protein TgHK011_009295 [Trichoderma gracile]|nr:hypothetical protein TgHK011_009295 [Trichoderma gracile]
MSMYPEVPSLLHMYESVPGTTSYSAKNRPNRSVSCAGCLFRLHPISSPLSTHALREGAIRCACGAGARHGLEEAGQDRAPSRALIGCDGERTQVRAHPPADKACHVSASGRNLQPPKRASALVRLSSFLAGDALQTAGLSGKGRLDKYALLALDPVRAISRD